MKRIVAGIPLACLLLSFAIRARAQAPRFVPSNKSTLTHGPSLGNIAPTSVRVWVRTRTPMEFRVRFSAQDNLNGATTSTSGRTTLEHDNTGWLELSGLKPNTKYFYAVQLGDDLVDTRIDGKLNSFTTLPDATAFRHAPNNPRGLFNFRFEFGCGNNQNPANNNPPDPPAFATMLRELKDKIHFQIMNGDWLYEEKRETTAEQWSQANGVKEAPPPVNLLRGMTGVWENYKLYLSRSRNLANFYREIPFFVTFDDHEILNDVYGCGEIGLRTDARRTEAQGPQGRETHDGTVERAVFRDPALQAWKDYLGWANPDIGLAQPIHYGVAKLTTQSNTLTDARADFTKLDLNKSATLHVQWGQGNTGVYEVVRVLDMNRLEVRPPAAVTEEARYSIGTNHHTRFSVSNCEFYLLDTRSHRTLHRLEKRDDPNTSMVGRRQREWLMAEMKRSEANFFFVVSSVNFMIPHVGGGQVVARNKDDAWTAMVQERDLLIRFFESLSKPVFILTGDLHNSFVVQIAPGVWEFASGAHNSNNHWTLDAGGAPPSGWFDSYGRKVKVKWSTGYLNDVPRNRLHYPNYCVVQVNNVYNSPDAEGKPRWVAFPEPQVIFNYYDGLTAELKYAESLSSLDAKK